MPTAQRALPTILFGAFDRHNLGDLLFPHIVSRLLDREALIFAGLADRDLSNAGGFPTRAISQLAREFRRSPVNVLHVGGELLTCSAWQAAVMLQLPEQAQQVIQRFEGHEEELRVWVSDVLGNTALAPYTLGHEWFPEAVNLIYTAVGGVELKTCEEPFRNEVITKLKQADYVSVRDQQTWGYLKQSGITCHLVPDPAVLIAELFDDQIEHYSHTEEMTLVHDLFHQGYIALQFSADFGDDNSLVRIAAQLDQLAEETTYGIVPFRAGAAPWHDDLECYRRLAGYVRKAQVKIFSSLNIWETCALISHSSAFCGSSLHGRIVAMGFGLPRVNINHPLQENRTGKQAAYAATWEFPGVPHCVDIDGIAAGVLRSLSADRDQLLIHAQALAAKYLEEFATVLALLHLPENREEIPNRI